MPAASARKSSLGASRRGPQKYIPYRADDFGHGKKTGIAVGIVDTTDEFEPFEKVMSQADQRTPFRPQGTRKKRGPKTPVPVREPSDDEENGEMSMDLDVTPHAPSAYFAHARVSTITSSMQRIGSSSRPVAHPSDVDFDDVPSPRASPSFTSKRSQANGNASRTSLPSRSRLSHSTIYRDDDDDDSDGDAGAPDYDYGDYGNDMDVDESPPPPPPQGSRTPRNGQTPRRTSFVHLDQEEDEHEEAQVEEEMEDYRRSPSEKARGKQPMAYQEDEQEMEPEIAQGFNDLDEQPMDEDPQEEEEAPPPKKGKKGREEKASKNSGKENDGAPRGRPRQKKVVLREGTHSKHRLYASIFTNHRLISTNHGLYAFIINRPRSPATPDDPNQDGLRRSKRRRYSPLAWWRLEKVVYGRRENGQSLVPSIKEIHRIAQMPAKPLGARRRRRGQSRKKSRTVEPEAQQVLVYNPEEGWDEKTDSRCLVREYGDEDKEVERRESVCSANAGSDYGAQSCGRMQVLHLLLTWSSRSLQPKARSTSRRSLATATSSRLDNSSSRLGRRSLRRAQKTTPSYVFLSPLHNAHVHPPFRSSMSSKARYSSVCTRPTLCCPPVACSWSREVSPLD